MLLKIFVCNTDINNQFVSIYKKHILHNSEIFPPDSPHRCFYLVILLSFGFKLNLKIIRQSYRIRDSEMSFFITLAQYTSFLFFPFVPSLHWNILNNQISSVSDDNVKNWWKCIMCHTSYCHSVILSFKWKKYVVHVVYYCCSFKHSTQKHFGTNLNFLLYHLLIWKRTHQLGQVLM